MKKLFLLLLLLPSLLLAQNQPPTFGFSPMTCTSSEGTGITTATTTEIVAGTSQRRTLLFKAYLQNISSTATLVQLKVEDGAILFEQKLDENQPAVFSVGNKYVQTTKGKGLELVTDATGDIRYSVCYNVE